MDTRLIIALVVVVYTIIAAALVKGLAPTPQERTQARPVSGVSTTGSQLQDATCISGGGGARCWYRNGSVVKSAPEYTF